MKKFLEILISLAIPLLVMWFGIYKILELAKESYVPQTNQECNMRIE